MKISQLISIVIIIGFIVLFFFPEPEDNFIAYIGTALFFIVLTIFLIIWQERRKK